jgi:subtilase-type serine protease
VALEPYAGFGYAHIATDGFKENGGSAALQAKSSSDDTPYTTLGLRASGDVARLQDAVVTVRGGLGWQHAYGDLTPSTNMRFSGPTSFQAQGLPIARDALTAEAGIDLAFTNRLTLQLGYPGQVSADSHAHGVDAKLSWSF